MVSTCTLNQWLIQMCHACPSYSPKRSGDSKTACMCVSHVVHIRVSKNIQRPKLEQLLKFYSVQTKVVHQQTYGLLKYFWSLKQVCSHCIALSRPLVTCNLITFSNSRNAFISLRESNLSHINIPFALPLRSPPACPSSYCHLQLLPIIFLPTWALTLLVLLWLWHLNPVATLNASFLT